MSVYVDPVMACLSNRNWRYDHVCHLEGDTDVELDAFAIRLGLKRAWKQAPKPPAFPWPHYDITRRKRAAAVRLGAIEMTLRETVDRWHRWRKDGWPGAAKPAP